MRRTRERLTPDPEALAETMKQAPSREVVPELMRQLLARMRGDRAGNLAMLELRAMSGLIVDDLTAPALLEPYSADDLIEQMVNRLLP